MKAKDSKSKDWRIFIPTTPLKVYLKVSNARNVRSLLSKDVLNANLFGTAAENAKSVTGPIINNSVIKKPRKQRRQR
jgi:hypothetical protein